VFEALAVVVAIDVPVSVNKTLLPTVPEIVQLCDPRVATKGGTVTFAPLTVTTALVGLNVKPARLGVTT
jgi:hypothetical protein